MGWGEVGQRGVILHWQSVSLITPGQHASPGLDRRLWQQQGLGVGWGEGGYRGSHCVGSQ